jgi:hypothetical protein
MLKVHGQNLTQNVKTERKDPSTTAKRDDVDKAMQARRDPDVMTVKRPPENTLNLVDVNRLALPSRSFFKGVPEQELAYFIGSNVLDTHVQMYAEIESEKGGTIATLYRDSNNIIQTFLEERKAPSYWLFSKESLIEVLNEAKAELEYYPDGKLSSKEGE